jgi:hypothetical protein
MRLVLALVLLLMPAGVHAQNNPFAPRLDQQTPPPGQPICSAWYAQQALPKFGCSPETIRKICAGALPKPNAGPFCGGLEAAGYDTARMGKTCKTTVGECTMNQAGPLNAACYCKDIADRMIQGWVVKP